MVRFTKNAASLWGTVTLHVGILVLIGMGILTYAFQQRGFVQLIEGDTFFGQSSQFLESEHGPLSPPFTPDFNVSLKGITPDYYPKGNLKALRSSILISRNANLLNSAELSINEPLDLGSIRVYQSISFGKTVVLEITTSSKRFLTYYSLERPLKSGDEFTGASDIPTTPYRLDLHLNTGSPVQGVASGSPRLRLGVKIGNTLAYSGTLGIGETANLGEMKLQFIEDRQWSGLIMVDRRFIVGVYAGFILVILGLVLVYGAPYRVIFMESVVAEHAREMRFGGVTRREQTLFHDEFNELMEKIFLQEGKIHVGTRMVEV